MFPPKPDFKPIVNLAERQKLFGAFKFVHAPTPDNKENISIQGDWARKNIIKVALPQLIGIAGAPSSGNIWCHQLVAKSLQGMFAAFEKEGLLDLIHTWGGMFAPRLIRGSATVLSNHAFGTAFDINAAWNMLGREPAKEGKLGCVYALVPIANRFGWYWGGHFSRPDGMHFEYTVVGK